MIVLPRTRVQPTKTHKQSPHAHAHAHAPTSPIKSPCPISPHQQTKLTLTPPPHTTTCIYPETLRRPAHHDPISSLLPSYTLHTYIRRATGARPTIESSPSLIPVGIPVPRWAFGLLGHLGSVRSGLFPLTALAGWLAGSLARSLALGKTWRVSKEPKEPSGKLL